MRIIILFTWGFLLASGPTALAFSTQNCPQIIKLNIQSFDFTGSHDQASTSKKEAINELQHSLRRLARLQVKFNLQFAGGAKCYYEGHNQRGRYYRAHIELKDESGTLSPYFTAKAQNYAFKVGLNSFERAGVEPSSYQSEIHYFEKSCPERGCPMTYTKVGTGNIRQLR